MHSLVCLLVFAAAASAQYNGVHSPRIDLSIHSEANASPQMPLENNIEDMVFTKEQQKIIKDKKAGIPSAIDKRVELRWKDAVIPYIIDCSIAHMPRAVEAVELAMKEWEAKTCIRFVKHTNQKFKLTFFRNTHCWGNVGQVSYSRISVGEGCDYHHVMTHEIGHAVGMYHEHNRMDRDDWVNVYWDNIGYFKDAFEKQPLGNTYGVDYDYESIMHYPWSAFSANGKDTMSPKKTSSKVPYIELSKLDILTTSRAYNCPKIEKERKEKGQTYLDQPLRTRNRIIEDLPDILEDNSCANKADDVKCEGWRKAGFCREHEYVKINCQKACFRCGVAPCANSAGDSNCEAWAKSGACAKDYIAKKHCQKTCAKYCEGGTKPTQPPVPTNPPTKLPPTNQPTGGPTNPPTNPPVTSKPKPTQKPKPGDKVFMGVGILCEDKYPDRCPQWAKQGECESNPGWMLSNCLVSCPKAHCDKKPQKPDDTCADPLGIGYDGSGSFKLPDSAFYSPDNLSPGGGWEAAAMNSRLYYRDDHDKKRIGAWCATSAQRDGDGRNFYMQVDLQQQKTIKYIATQGRDRYFEHVKAYSIKYSNNKQDWTDYSENGKVKVFDGSCDHFTPVLNKFTTPIAARYIRVYPTNWNYPCMRMELFGC